MKTEHFIKVIAAICLLPLGALAQFSSGSTGADGPLNVVSNMTLNLPPDGIFNFTTITFANGTTLTFNRNPLNTPVYMLATGDVVINNGAAISVSGGNNQVTSPGIGGSGGFDGGFGAYQGVPNGDGQGPGGGRGGSAGVYALPSGGNSNVYGNTLITPLIGGSGGSAGNFGGDSGGGGGGGAILISSTTRVIIEGAIYADGGNGYIGGSGGGIRVVAPVVGGGGTLVARPGGGVFSSQSPGRIRIDSLDRLAHRRLTFNGMGTRGSQMFVFPPGNPRLDIIHAAGRDIPEGTNATVSVSLPVGSSTNQIVRVQARGFTNDIPIRVRITPENAPSATFDGVITNTGNPSVGEVTVALPLDNVCYVHVWTR